MTAPIMDGYIYIGDLSDRHQRALRTFVSKYRKGAIDHGDLARGRRWSKDRLEERIDDNFYAIFDLLEIEDVLEEMEGIATPNDRPRRVE